MTIHLDLAHRLPRPIAFVLGGGGSWGALHLGMLQALAQTDIVPDMVVGTSVGSLNGAILAADPGNAVSRLEGLWPTVSRNEVFPGGLIRGLRTLSTSKAWLYDNEPLTDYLTKSLPATTFEQLALPFVAVATDFSTGTIAELDSGDLRSALLASSAIPGIYPWVERDGRRLVDGVLVANVPIGVAMRRGARSLVVLDCGLQGVDSGAATNLVEVLAQSSAIYARRQIAADLEHVAHLPMIWLSRGTLNATNQLDFSQTATLIEQGFTHSMATLRGLSQITSLPPGLYGAPEQFQAHPLIRPLIREAQGGPEPAESIVAEASAPSAGPGPVEGAVPEGAPVPERAAVLEAAAAPEGAPVPQGAPVPEGAPVPGLSPDTEAELPAATAPASARAEVPTTRTAPAEEMPTRGAPAQAPESAAVDQA